MHPIMQCYQEAATVIQDSIERFQENCEHPDNSVFKVYDASTGNWDRGDDSYWANLRCYSCNKYWRADSEKDDHDYRFKGLRVLEFPKACHHWSGADDMSFWDATIGKFWCEECKMTWVIPPER